MADVETIVAVMAAEARELWPELQGPIAWAFATGLLAGYRLGDPTAAHGMMMLGEADWRQLVRDAGALAPADFAPAASDLLDLEFGIHG